MIRDDLNRFRMINSFRGIRFDTLHTVESIVEDGMKIVIKQILKTCHLTKTLTLNKIHKYWTICGRSNGLASMPKSRHGCMSQCTPGAISLLISLKN